MNLRQLSLLEEIIDNGLKDLAIPYVKKNSIRIKHLVIRHSKKAGWLIYDTKENKQVAQLYCKYGAIALAKSIAERRPLTDKIINLDRIIQKHVNDCLFYKHSMDKADNIIKYESIANRYDVSIAISQQAKDDLEKIILS